MWRLLPILAGLGTLGLLIPWGNIAALVLSDASPMELHETANGRSYEAQLQRPGFVAQHSSEPSDRALNVGGARDTDHPRAGWRIDLLLPDDGLAHVAEITFWSPGARTRPALR